jgi:hypothetical protein
VERNLGIPELPALRDLKNLLVYRPKKGTSFCGTHRAHAVPVIARALAELVPFAPAWKSAGRMDCRPSACVASRELTKNAAARQLSRC